MHQEKVNFHFANCKFSFRKLQIFISQTTDFHFANYSFHFANYRFSFRFVPFRFVPFRFAPFRFANYSKPSENGCHALSVSEINLAVVRSLGIIGHVTNCCKRPIRKGQFQSLKQYDIGYNF